MTALLYIYVTVTLSLVACSSDNPVIPDVDESLVIISTSEEAAEMRADIKASGGQKYIFTDGNLACPALALDRRYHD